MTTVTLATDRAAVSATPRALIVTVYGLYAREADGWIAVSALIRLLAELGVDETAVRSSISRLKQRGLLLGERLNGLAGYALSERAQEILREGDRRIFARPRASLADGWVLAVFSVPESERDRRHTLRSRLAWLGFGTVAPGVWIAPAHLAEETVEVLERYDLTAYVDLFHARTVAGALASSVRTWWDLNGLAALYDEFLAGFAPVRSRWRRRRRANPAAAFADYVGALTAWRRLPFLDPGLPPELLPARWHGARAADLFGDLQVLLQEPARAHVATILGS